MKILYIMDSKEKSTEDYINKLNVEKDVIKIVKLNEVNINECTGCFSCWLRTPGKCIFNDSMNELYSFILEYDRTVFVSSIKMGFISSKTKNFLDRMIPIELPYFEFINKEFHHKGRYDKKYKFGVILEKEKITNNKDIEIIKEFYKKVSINFHADLEFVHVIDKEVV